MLYLHFSSLNILLIRAEHVLVFLQGRMTSLSTSVIISNIWDKPGAQTTRWNLLISGFTWPGPGPWTPQPDTLTGRRDRRRKNERSGRFLETMEQTNGSAAVSVLKVFPGTSGGLGGPLFSGCVEIKARKSLCRKVLVSHVDGRKWIGSTAAAGGGNGNKWQWNARTGVLKMLLYYHKK